jgi:hypothetical protein
MIVDDPAIGGASWNCETAVACGAALGGGLNTAIAPVEMTQTATIA